VAAAGAAAPVAGRWQAAGCKAGCGHGISTACRLLKCCRGIYWLVPQPQPLYATQTGCVRACVCLALCLCLQNVTADEMFHQILHAPLDFEAPPWDTLSSVFPHPANLLVPCRTHILLIVPILHNPPSAAFIKLNSRVWTCQLTAWSVCSGCQQVD
jgi:hypothetical protein